MTPELPGEVRALADELAAMPGAVAVVLGGSRAEGSADGGSDWDLGVYYRGALDTTALAARGAVHPPGAWGRIMNGGAWLTCGELKVDVILRDLDVVEHWAARARDGEYDVDFLLSYLAGIPTYSLLAELAIARVIRGELPAAGPFPPRLAEAAPPRWRFHAGFNLSHARSRAARGDAAGAVGLVARAAIEHAHALLCARATWVLNEKRILARAALPAVEALLASGPGGAAPERLGAWVAEVERALPA